MRIAAYCAFTVVLFCLTTDGHYIPPRHYWTKSFHHPFSHHMYHHLAGHQTSQFLSPDFQTHSSSSHAYPSAFQPYPSAFQAYPSAFQESAPVFQEAQVPTARPAFPAPGSITSSRVDQSLTLLAGALSLRQGAVGSGLISILSAF